MNWRLIKKSLVISSLALVVLMSASMLSVRSLGLRSLSVQSGSMAPTIDKGDLVLVKNVPYQDLQVGDVITYINPENEATTITHRVVQTPSREVPNKFITQGDANADPDPLVDYTAVLGKVEHTLPFVGKGVDFVRTWPGLIAIVYLPSLWIIAGEFRRLSTYYKSRVGYVMAGYDPLHGKKPKARTHLSPLAKVRIAGAATVATLALSAIPVHAALMAQVSLTSTSITTVAKTPEHTDQAAPPDKPIVTTPQETDTATEPEEYQQQTTDQDQEREYSSRDYDDDRRHYDYDSRYRRR